MTCVLVSFSSRKNGNCNKILDFLSEIIPDSISFRFSEFQLSPCGSCEGECFQRRDLCPHYQDMEKTLIHAVCSSDLACYVIPNHCDYPCSNFFTFNERSQCCFQGDYEQLEHYLQIPKKFIVVSNSESQHFRDVFLQHTDKEPDICFFSAKKYGKRSISGDILTSEQACLDLQAYAFKELL